MPYVRSASVGFFLDAEGVIVPGSAIMCQRTVIGGLILLHAATAAGQAPAVEPPPNTASPSAEQVIYRGIVGNLLESVSLDSGDRVQLQRANALLSTPLGARSLAVALGIASPPLMLAGLLWGLWSAAKIKPTEPVAQRAGPSAQQTSHLVHDGRNAATHREDVNALATLEAVPLDHLSRYATASALAAVVGGSGPGDRAVPCDNCVMPMLDLRAMPTPR